jgi:hypothetical protein
MYLNSQCVDYLSRSHNSSMAYFETLSIVIAMIS